MICLVESSTSTNKTPFLEGTSPTSQPPPANCPPPSALALLLSLPNPSYLHYSPHFTHFSI
ncbi:hypothetical protein LguiA_003421 [Lonicera macranthoides]